MPTDTAIEVSAAVELNTQSSALIELNKVDPENWLAAVKLEAAKQAEASGSLEVGNNTLEARSRSDWRYRIESMFTDKLENVGDVDTDFNIRRRMYDVSNERGGLSDTTRGAWHKFCQGPNAGANVQVRFILDGQWGAVNGVNGWQMRQAIIESMWKTANEVGIRNGYTVYNNCYGFTWQEAKPNSADSACGPKSKTQCPQNRDCPAGGMECKGMKWGTWLPSITRVNVFNRDDSLRADAYQVRISSARPGSNGCSKSAEIAGIMTSFIPLAGSYIAAGVKTYCVFQQ
jgi:hypothetical protein